MALSESVESNLNEAKSALRNALAFAARQEEPYISILISKALKDVDGIIRTDKVVDQLQNLLINPPDKLNN
jgi:hypothetical protein